MQSSHIGFLNEENQGQIYYMVFKYHVAEASEQEIREDIYHELEEMDIDDRSELLLEIIGLDYEAWCIEQSEAWDTFYFGMKDG